MKTIKDRDLNIDCDHVSTGQTTQEVVQAATQHIQTEHPDEYDRVKSMLKMNIKENSETDSDESETESEGDSDDALEDEE